jgi:DNA repair exonuclease SbcCD ATPase subunit
MRLIRLYIKDFMCYDWAYIDFTEFNSALIVGKTENNDAESNGAGKTSIFKAIEYVLFNQSNFNLERIIRDDAPSCKIVLDFAIGTQEYRLARTRTRKGSTDLSLYERSGEAALTESVLHTDKFIPLFDDKYWKDISGRRAADTEKDLAKLVKVNFKSFRVFVHFMQNDFSGLATATPEKRKGILKDALNLIIYSKLEKIAKDKSSTLSKEIDRLRTLVENIGDPDQEIAGLVGQLSKIEKDILDRSFVLGSLEAKQLLFNEKVNQLTNEHANLEGKFSSLVVKEQMLNSEKSRLETSVKEYHSKKSNIIKAAHDLVTETKQLEEIQIKLIEIDYAQIDILSEQIITNKEQAAQLNLTIQNDMVRCEKLKKPIPKDGECEECRQPITAEHRKICQTNLNDELHQRQQNIQNCKKALTDLNTQNTLHQQTINSLMLSKQHLESINTKIATKKKEVIDKRETHDEYTTLLVKFTTELDAKNLEIEQVVKDLQNSAISEAKILQTQIQLEKQNTASITIQIGTANKELTHFTSGKAVIQHNLNQKTEEKRKKLDYLKLLKELEDKLGVYPLVLQAFSSTGIPNLIIHNILDDLQSEVNSLLSQFRPGLQLTFSIEKTKGDGTEADTLEIDYQVSGKDRYYEQLSGAMQLAVTFSLKLGLSFLLQKMMGINIQFLLLDEIDQSLDKTRVDAFADIVKFLQKDFTILVITHNDRLKDKFSHAVLVEQDINMISHAQVVSSW